MPNDNPRNAADDLIEAIGIIRKYLDDNGEHRFSGASHDAFWIAEHDEGWAHILTPDDAERLELLGF